MIEQLNLLFLVLLASVDACIAGVEAFVFFLKNVFLKLVFSLAGQENHNFYITLLSGNKKLLTSDQELLLKITGMQHLFSVSGMHLSMILAGCRFFLRRFLAIRTVLPLVALVWLYAYFVDLRPSVVRAATMTTISLIIAQYLKRKVSSLYLLFLAVVVLFAVEPSYVEKVGFQLSVAGVVGVATSQYFSSYKDISNLWSNNFSDNFFKSSFVKRTSLVSRVMGMMSDTLFISIFASLFIFPLVVFYFGEVTFSSLLANPLVLWVVPYVMIAGFMQMALGSFLCNTPVLKTLILVISLVVDVPLNMLVSLLKLVAKIPFFTFSSASVSVKTLFIYYFCLIAFLVFIHLKKRSKYQVFI